MCNKTPFVSYNTTIHAPHTVERAIFFVVATGRDEGDCSRGVASRRSVVLRGNDTLEGLLILEGVAWQFQ